MGTVGSAATRETTSAAKTSIITVEADEPARGAFAAELPLAGCLAEAAPSALASRFSELDFGEFAGADLAAVAAAIAGFGGPRRATASDGEVL